MRSKKAKPANSFVFHYAIQDSFGDELTVEDFPRCCGAKVIVGFPMEKLEYIIRDYLNEWRIQYADYRMDSVPKGTSFESHSQPTQSEVRTMLLRDIQRHLPFVEHSAGTVTFVILNDDQKWIAPVLKEKGFRLVSDRTVNSRTKNRLYVYLRDPVTSKGKTVRKRMFK